MALASQKMKKIKSFVWEILRILRLGGIVQLILDSLLTRNGWFKSYYTKQAIDSMGRPLPWCTYSYIRFIGPRLNKGMQVFEFGCGNSTLWFADRVMHVSSVEHDEKWASYVKTIAPANVTLNFQALEYGGEYSKMVLLQGRKFDIVVVDGRDRVNCARNAIHALHEKGVIVFDNSDRDDYLPAMELLAETGFRRIDFFGMSPVTAHENVTTIFYRDYNCLGI